MSRKYKFRNPERIYFVSFAVVEWLVVFTRNEYKDILLESLSIGSLAGCVAFLGNSMKIGLFHDPDEPLDDYTIKPNPA